MCPQYCEVICYNESKTRISLIIPTVNASLSYTNNNIYTITTPDTCKYIVVNFYSSVTRPYFIKLDNIQNNSTDGYINKQLKLNRDNFTELLNGGRLDEFTNENLRSRIIWGRGLYTENSTFKYNPSYISSLGEILVDKSYKITSDGEVYFAISRKHSSWSTWETIKEMTSGDGELLLFPDMLYRLTCRYPDGSSEGKHQRCH